MLSRGSLFLILLLASISAGSQKCYGVALEGGGSHGAYEAGALLAITELLPPEERTYSIVTGISAGALNTCQTVGYAPGDERNMAIHVSQFWLNITGNKEIASHWFGGTFFSLLFRPSLYNNANELVYIKKNIGDVIKRNVTVASTNLNTGNFTRFTQDVGIDQLPLRCFSSGSFPMFFPPVLIDGQYYGDGAVVSNLDGYDAVSKCRELGYDDKDIVIDFLFDESTGALPPLRVGKTFDVIHRIRKVSGWSNGYWYVQQNFRDFPDVDFRLVVIPTKPLPPLKAAMPMDFNPVDIKFEIDLGYNDTRTLINMNKQERLAHTLRNLENRPHYL
jgi:predicted acylesterase/phospholipase RssA